ncbi:PH domain-containing protein [Rhizohabitans arisaemae]|uniref:PH domain-containing protein n=1 Tax=Rhizohabitans arisaemae TaxID=2720610 RepID=UPI0024B0D272|nr:PH domain-containing protein [Rhizohabitans arisaemae]
MSDPVAQPRDTGEGVPRPPHDPVPPVAPPPEAGAWPAGGADGPRPVSAGSSPQAPGASAVPPDAASDGEVPPNGPPWPYPGSGGTPHAEEPGTPYGSQPPSFGFPVHRLSPLVLLLDPVRMLPSMFIPLVGVFFFGGFSPVSYGVAAVIFAFSVAYSAVRWATFTYQVVGDRLELTRSLVSRSVRTIPLERVRGVDVSASLPHRLLGLAVLRVDTGASGGEQEGELDGLTLAEARRVRTLLLRQSPARTAASGGESDVITRAPVRWLLFGPLSGAYLLTPFALLASAAGLVSQLRGEYAVDPRSAWRFLGWMGDRPWLVAVAAVLILIAMPLFGTIMYAIFNWGFTLRVQGSSLVAERGLFTRRTVTLERRRIRGFELVDSVLERRAGVARLWAIVAGLGDSTTRGQLLPVAPRAAAGEVAGRVVGPFTTPLTRHPPAARRRRLFRATAPWALVAAAGVALASIPVAVTGLVLALAGIPLGLDRYRWLGHAFDGRRFSVREGSLTRRQAVVERRAVVGWTVRESWFQRRAGLVTVIAGVGAGSGGYPAKDIGTAEGAEFARTVTPAWITPFLAEPHPGRNT